MLHRDYVRLCKIKPKQEQQHEGSKWQKFKMPKSTTVLSTLRLNANNDDGDSDSDDLNQREKGKKKILPKGENEGKRDEQYNIYMKVQNKALRKINERNWLECQKT